MHIFNITHMKCESYGTVYGTPEAETASPPFVGALLLAPGVPDYTHGAIPCVFAPSCWSIAAEDMVWNGSLSLCCLWLCNGFGPGTMHSFKS
jgi:hypothetical protein